jgi:hypothetical protein
MVLSRFDDDKSIITHFMQNEALSSEKSLQQRGIIYIKTKRIAYRL